MDDDDFRRAVVASLEEITSSLETIASRLRTLDDIEQKLNWLEMYGMQLRDHFTSE